jgi:hypothetical protein
LLLSLSPYNFSLTKLFHLALLLASTVIAEEGNETGGQKQQNAWPVLGAHDTDCSFVVAGTVVVLLFIKITGNAMN